MRLSTRWTSRLACVALISWATADIAISRADELAPGPAWRHAYFGKHAAYPNRQWPAPYQPADRDTVRAAFGAMENQGWLRAHTLGDHLFDPTSQSLTDAGRIRVRAIASNAPSTRRMVFVSVSSDATVNAARVENVRVFVRGLPVRAGQLEVSTIDADPAETPALNVEELNRETRLPPIRNLSPQPLFFPMGAANAERE